MNSIGMYGSMSYYKRKLEYIRKNIVKNPQAYVFYLRARHNLNDWVWKLLLELKHIFFL